ncbi:ubiquitin-like-specific protease 1D [Bidens hawaiensis]|uniref:ubiquitin-like-specific protease 1D n=1 Tax=Bidens hawaiensis TaxID=980011 RepID=UPI00404B869C
MDEENGVKRKKPEEKSADEDLELMGKSDREIAESVARIKRNFQTIGVRLPDGGQKFKANLMRHERELERRNKLQLDKADNGCEETIHLSDHSDDGASHGKKKSLSKYADFVRKKMEEDKDSRTVCAFEKDSPYINPCQGRKSKSKSQLPGKGRCRKTSLANRKRKINSIDKQEDGDSPTSFSEPNSPQDPPSMNLRPRFGRSYCLVDEEPVVQKFMLNLDLSVKDGKIYYPSRDDPNSVEVDHTHIACLAPEACISSIIMNFYIRYLQQQSSSSKSATCHFHFFNTYFYNKLEKLSYKEDSFLKFRKWWKGVSLFEKAYILLPVHENAHWSLVIICLPGKEDELGPTLLHLDSLGLHDSMSLFDNIKRFLKEEWSYLTKSKSPAGSPVTDEICENLDQRVDHKRVTVPQQKNDYDCGLFVLLYMERFIKEAPERFRKKDLSMFSRQWFRPQEASKLRGKIYDLLVEEFKKAKEKESTSSPKT